MSHYYAKFKENPCVGTDASTPLIDIVVSKEMFEKADKQTDGWRLESFVYY